MSLRKKQSEFARCVGLLLQFMTLKGYEYTLGDAFAKTGHIAASFHYKKLAIDINLFLDNKYLSATSDHKIFGEFWESLSPECSWGGRFRKKDGNHYSFGEIRSK